MYELLFRSRWYALVWALLMTISAVTFTTTGAGAWLTSSRPDTRASEEARESQFRVWAEDDKRRMNDETGFDPSSPEQVRDGMPPRQNADGTIRQTAPFAQDDTDEDSEDDSTAL
ncbi:hypothetical protein [Novosphingobium sp.]|uniref:hypothetical protein n=1 Tax=Novosphingobium sp. TaxID=1874826 RepID=UPI003BAB1237